MSESELTKSQSQTYIALVNRQKIDVEDFDALPSGMQEGFNREYELFFERGKCWLAVPPNEGFDKEGASIKKGDKVTFTHDGMTIHSEIWQIDSKGRIWLTVPPTVEITDCKQHREHGARITHRYSADVLKV